MEVWTGQSYHKLKVGTVPVHPIIPKRGEKYFELASGGGLGFQIHVLDRARAAIFDALKADRTII